MPKMATIGDSPNLTRNSLESGEPSRYYGAVICREIRRKPARVLRIYWEQIPPNYRVRQGFMAMKQGITKERVQMEKIWKEREKQLEKVLISTSGMYGSVKGIAGASIADIPLLDGTDEIEIDN
jgi:hypothetical protein